MTVFTSSTPPQKWPAELKPSSMALNQQSNTSRFSSPFTRTSQTQELPGGLFKLSADFPIVFGAKVGIARAWAAKLRGAAGRFYWPANGRDFNILDANAAQLIRWVPFSADLTVIKCDSTTVTIDADKIIYDPIFTPDGLSDDATAITGTLWLNSDRNPLEVGCFISFDDADEWRHLHIVVDIEHDPLSGAATLTVEPPMRAMPTSGTPIHTINPSGIFAAVNDDQLNLNHRPGSYAEMASLDAVQAFPLKVAV
jgi:hypothetical protein